MARALRGAEPVFAEVLAGRARELPPCVVGALEALDARRSARGDRLAGAQLPVGEDVGAQPALVDERAEGAGPAGRRGEALEVGARREVVAPPVRA